MSSPAIWTMPTWHLESIHEKGLPGDGINAYNHMAIYLRWCLEHDLMSTEFMERYGEQVQPFMPDLSRADLRGFIRDQLKGQLFRALSTRKAQPLPDTTMARRTALTSPATLTTMPWSISAQSNIIPISFQDEAYLFIPFDEAYYQAMAKVMESGSPTGRDRASMRPLWSLRTLRSHDGISGL